MLQSAAATQSPVLNQPRPNSESSLDILPWNSGFGSTLLEYGAPLRTAPHAHTRNHEHTHTHLGHAVTATVRTKTHLCEHPPNKIDQSPTKVWLPGCLAACHNKQHERTNATTNASTRQRPPPKFAGWRYKLEQRSDATDNATTTTSAIGRPTGQCVDETAWRSVTVESM